MYLTEVSLVSFNKKRNWGVVTMFISEHVETEAFLKDDLVDIHDHCCVAVI